MSDILSFIKQERPSEEQPPHHQDENYIALMDPSPDEACTMINKYRAKYVIVLYGNLKAHYEGRAKSDLELAPRLVILKPDGALLIHEATKREPVIWQPPKASLYAQVDNGVLVLKSVRSSPYEVVRIEIPSLYFLGLFKLGISENYRVYGSEKDIVDYIVKNPDIIEQGLKIIAREYETNVGSIDILAEDSNGNLVVIEVKRGQAGPEAVHQLKRYVEHMQKVTGREVRGILVAQDISSSAYRYLREYGFKFVRIPQKVLLGKMLTIR